MDYRELKNYWSIERIPHNGMWVLHKEFDKVLRADTFEACTSYILEDENIWDACLAYDDIDESNINYPTHYFYTKD